MAYSCPMVLAELQSKLVRAKDPEAGARIEAVRRLTAVIEPTAEIGLEAGKIHASMRSKGSDFGMADAFILASVRARGVRVLSKDKDFQSLPDAEVL